MALIADARKLIDQNDVKYRASVSESAWTKIGGMLNFIANRNHQEKQFFLNGPYLTGEKLDGLTVFNFNATIINVYAFNIVAGSAGVTEFDIKLKPQTSGSFTSIFTTRPQISYLTGGPTWVGIGDVIANTTAPVLTSAPNGLNVNQGDALVLDLLQAQTGGQNCGIICMYRPR